MRTFPEISGESLQSVCSWVRMVTQIRHDDISDNDALSDKADGYASFETATADITVGKKRIILVDSTSGDINVTVPSAASLGNKILIVKKADDSANTVSVVVDGAGTIDNSASYDMSTAYQSVTLFSDGTEYWSI